MSSLELNKDGVYIIVRNWAKKMKEDLNEEELRKWGTPLLIEHLNKKMTISVSHKDPMFAAASSFKPNYETKPGKPEKGIKIHVGERPAEEEKKSQEVSV